MLVDSEKVPEKHFDCPGKVLEFFVIKSVATLDKCVIAIEFCCAVMCAAKILCVDLSGR